MLPKMQVRIMFAYQSEHNTICMHEMKGQYRCNDNVWFGTARMNTDSTKMHMHNLLLSLPSHTCPPLLFFFYYQHSFHSKLWMPEPGTLWSAHKTGLKNNYLILVLQILVCGFVQANIRTKRSCKLQLAVLRWIRNRKKERVCNQASEHFHETKSPLHCCVGGQFFFTPFSFNFTMPMLDIRHQDTGI